VIEKNSLKYKKSFY